MPSPVEGEHGQHDRKVYPYGVGIDCHSTFSEICVLIPQGADLTTLRLKANADWPQLRTAHEWVVNTLRRHGIELRTEELRDTLESTGQYHMPLCLAWKGRPSIINPSDTSTTRRKTDVLDAGKLALQSLTGLDRGRTVKGVELLENLDTVPWVGTWTACVWLAEVGDICRFSHPKKLCAYAGLDPSLGVSAGKVTSRLMRKGNVRLSVALRNATRAAVCNPRRSSFTGWVRGYIGRHPNAGKSKALKAMARRVCKALYYVHLRCEPFSEAMYRPLLSESSYPQCSVDDMGFTPHVVRILKKNELLTSKQVVEAFYGDLARRPGCGSSTVRQVAAWVNQQQRAPGHRKGEDRPPKDAIR